MDAKKNEKNIPVKKDVWIPAMQFSAEVRPYTRIRKTELMKRIAAYLQAHYAEKVTLETVAQHCGVSVSTIIQMFQKNTDVSFLDLLTQCRVDAAEALIREGVPLEEIGKRVGYSSHSSFYRAFKIRSSISPREYRQALNLKKEIIGG